MFIMEISQRLEKVYKGISLYGTIKLIPHLKPANMTDNGSVLTLKHSKRDYFLQTGDVFMDHIFLYSSVSLIIEDGVETEHAFVYACSFDIFKSCRHVPDDKAIQGNRF